MQTQTSSADTKNEDRSSADKIIGARNSEEKRSEENKATRISVPKIYLSKAAVELQETGSVSEKQREEHRLNSQRENRLQKQSSDLVEIDRATSPSIDEDSPQTKKGGQIKPLER